MKLKPVIKGFKKKEDTSKDFTTSFDERVKLAEECYNGGYILTECFYLPSNRTEVKWYMCYMLHLYADNTPLDNLDLVNEVFKHIATRYDRPVLYMECIKDKSKMLILLLFSNYRIVCTFSLECGEYTFFTHIIENEEEIQKKPVIKEYDCFTQKEKDTYQDLWLKVLDTICTADSDGCRPCDLGCPCDTCVHDIHLQRKHLVSCINMGVPVTPSLADYLTL